MRTSFIYLFILFLSMPIFSQVEASKPNLPVTLETADNFSISLPDGWVEIPREVLDEFMANLRMLMPTAPQQYYNYGYQIKDKEWLDYPYILIQINRQGRIPENELKQYRQLKKAMEEGMDKVQSDLINNAKQGEMFYETENKILWTSMSMTVQGVGDVKAMLAFRLTKYGAISIMMYSTAEEYENYKDTYRDIALNVNIAPEIEYESKLHEQVHPGILKVVIVLVVGLIIFGIKKVFS